jgi:hypothetical protein
MVDTLMIAVLPQAGHRHRRANGEAALGSQSQRVSAWFMGALLVEPDPAVSTTLVALWQLFQGLRGIEWVIFGLKTREKRGLQGDSAFWRVRYLA